MHNQQFFRWHYLLAILLVTIGLSSCGLKMRQAIVLPYNTIFIGGAITQELRINLNRYLSAGTNARMVSTPKDADLLIMLNETNGKQILSYNNLGQVTAYRLITQITFYVNNKEGIDVIKMSTDDDVKLRNLISLSGIEPVGKKFVFQYRKLNPNYKSMKFIKKLVNSSFYKSNIFNNLSDCIKDSLNKKF